MRGCIALVIVAACGRVGFDPLGDDERAPDAAGGGDPGSDGSAEANLIVHFTFDDDPSDGADDAMARHPASCETMCPQSDVGHIAGAFLFNGADEALAIADAPDLRPASLTVTTWVYAIASFGGTIAGKSYGSGALESWQLSITGDGRLQVCTTIDAGTQRCDAMGEVPSGEWHHVAYVRGGGVHRSYIDGTRIIEAPVTGLDDDGALSIGVDIDGGVTTAYLRGILDDLRIYDAALSDAQVAALAAN